MARIEAVVRRRRRSEVRLNAWPVLHAELEIRSDQYQAFVSGQSLGLTRREFELLALLAEVPGQVVEREEIYQKVWGYAMAHGDRSVDVFVRKLRQKLQQPLTELAPHPHALRDRLPLRSRACRTGVDEPLESAAPVELPEGRLDEVTGRAELTNGQARRVLRFTSASPDLH